MTWSWHTGVLEPGARCAAAACAQPLRGHQVVNWVDSRRYHTGCLLTQIALEVTQELPKVDLCLGGWAPP